MTNLSDRELGAVLAGLRALQNVQQHEQLADEILDIMTDGGRFPLMDDDEIDALCERLNSDEDEPEAFIPSERHGSGVLV